MKTTMEQAVQFCAERWIMDPAEAIVEWSAEHEKALSAASEQLWRCQSMADEYGQLLSVVGDIVEAGHMNQEDLAILRGFLEVRR